MIRRKKSKKLMKNEENYNKNKKLNTARYYKDNA